MPNLDDLYIRSKFDIDRAYRLLELEYPRVVPYIPNMLDEMASTVLADIEKLKRKSG